MIFLKGDPREKRQRFEVIRGVHGTQYGTCIRIGELYNNVHTDPHDSNPACG
eukprot:COSAG02_NODE_966_length_15587_cov_19.602376_5_plen_52_part_00